MSEEGGEETPPRPKRRIKKVMVMSSASESDSDESVGVSGTRRKRLRVVSDEDASDSSGSSVMLATRKRALPKLRDSDADSDSSGWATDGSDAPKPDTSSLKPTSGFASDSSEGNSDKCSICLLRFKDQEVGTPQTCEHIFCLDCITEWSKNVNTCPVDRISFDYIVVRACAGGKVLRTEPVKVVERRSSVDLLVVEDPTVCEICGSAENEEAMLLCDGCDLGYHMQCLSPPLTEVPLEQWLCANCDDLLGVIQLSEVDDLFSGIMDIELPQAPRQVPLRHPRSVRRSARNQPAADEPSTSSGRGGSAVDQLPTTSRGTGSRTSRINSTRGTTRTRASRKRRRNKRRTKTVIIEYEVEENGKFPITRRVKRRVRKRKTRKRQPRTVARRSHVRQSVREKLAALKFEHRPELAQGSIANQNLSYHRHLAGIPSLSILGNPDQLDYFSDEDVEAPEGASTAVAVRPTSNILSAYRQARRKIITIPSPPHVSSASDILSSIMESQTLFHSKKSVVSVSVDGKVNIKLEKRESSKKEITLRKDQEVPKKEENVDLSKGDDATRKVPSYPGQSRGGWGGGYRGNYHREQNSNNFNRQGNNYDNNYNGNNYQNRGNFQHNNAQREDMESYSNYSRRPNQYSNDDMQYDRPRRPIPEGRNNQLYLPQHQGRHSLGAPRNGPPQNNSNYNVNQVYTPPARHSFGGFENPLDMRMGQVPTRSVVNNPPFAGERPQNPPFTGERPQSFRPLSEPPMLKLDKPPPELEKSEDENDSGLVIDTEKYDPTEPTNDEDSGDEGKVISESATVIQTPTVAPLPAPPFMSVENILAGVDTSSLNVPSNVLDSAVRQAIQEHRNLNVALSHHDKSDDDSDGDCPNFSIYSATSVHIASTSSNVVDDVRTQTPPDNMEDLVQEEDDIPLPSESPDAVLPPESNDMPLEFNTVIPPAPSYGSPFKKKEEEYNEKISKRCPITTSTRNPIKIKLHTSSLIKRHTSLYDDEGTSVDVKERDKGDPATQNNDISEPVDTDIQEDDKLQKTVQEESPIIEKSDKNDDDEAQTPFREESNEEKVDENEEGNDSSPSPKYDDEESVATPKPDDDKCDVSEKNYEEANGHKDKSESEQSDDECSEKELGRIKKDLADKTKGIEKMTESISETEDERSYTPCLDENKSKDTSLETDKDRALEGLDTEMISEEEGNDIFSDHDKGSVVTQTSPPKADDEEGEIPKNKKETDESKKKKKKQSRKDSKEKKSKKKSDVVFKKIGKNGKDRNYREREKDGKRKERRDSSDSAERQRRRKEKRKDLERYDVRNVVSEKRRKVKDAFGRDISPSSPPRGSASPRRSLSRGRKSSSKTRRSRSLINRSRSPIRRSLSPMRRSRSPIRRSRSPIRRSRSLIRRSRSPIRRSRSLIRHSRSPIRRSRTPIRRRSLSKRRSLSRGRFSPVRRSVSKPRVRRKSPAASARSLTPRLRRKSAEPRRKPSPRRRRSRSKAKASKKKKRAERTSPRRSPRRKPLRRKRKRVSVSPPSPAPSLASCLLSPRTPPPHAPPPPPPHAPHAPHAARLTHKKRRREERHYRRLDAGPSKEVFTSGDNILVSVSFKEQEAPAAAPERRKRKEAKRRRKSAQNTTHDVTTNKPVAIIDLDRSPFRELTPSPKNVIVVSDSETETRDMEPPAAPAAPAPHPAPHPATHPAPHPQPEPVGPKTPPEPAQPEPESGEAGPLRRSPDAYDPFEPTNSPSPASPGSPAASPARAPAAAPAPATRTLTLEAAQKTNLSADQLMDTRPIEPIEKVMALLQSTRDESPEPPPAPAADGPPAPGPRAPGPPAPGPPASPPPPPPVRIVLPSPSQPPKLFLGKPSPIKSNPIKPMQATNISRLPLPLLRRRDDDPVDVGSESPYSPGSSDFGDLFDPPPPPPPSANKRDSFGDLFDNPPRHATHNKSRRSKLKHTLRPKKRGNKTQVGVKMDEDNLKIMDELPSSAVEMQVKSKFLKKLNRQERVVEEVKLVLKPHYNKKRVTKEDYKYILRRAVPKICHNKSGEINPTKIQALVEAYVKKFRKKRKLGLA